MGKRIVVLNGSPRANGNTAGLVDAFVQGAREAGHSVQVFALQRMDIRPCLGCLRGGAHPDHPCTQRDDMDKIYPEYQAADVLVFASPLYHWTITAQMKAALDRLFAVTELHNATPHKECAILVAAEEDSEENFALIAQYYEGIAERLGWKDRGRVFAGGLYQVGDLAKRPQALQEARALGAAL